ncbi:MAG: S-layer homology domain-containing protein [Halanaerobium sp.]|nr:S-layer homology domain-containing protein [Halanaerobium sp.]
MRKLVVWTLVVMMLAALSGVGLAQKEIADVSPGHWAYDSVKYLVEQGYFSLYEDGTFRGNQPVSRYELAVILARILNNIDEQKVSASSGDVETLRKLTIEFREELVQIARQQEIFQEKITNLEEEDVVLQEDINGIYLEVRNLINSIQEMAEREAEREKRIAQLETKVAQLEQQLTEEQANKEELQSRIVTLEEEIIYLQEEQSSLKDYVDQLKTGLSWKEKEVQSAENQSNQMKYILGGVLVLALLLGSS